MITEKEKNKLVKASNDLDNILKHLGLELVKTKNVQDNLGMRPGFALLRYIYLREKKYDKKHRNNNNVVNR